MTRVRTMGTRLTMAMTISVTATVIHSPLDLRSAIES